jgi:hypothetical protein
MNRTDRTAARALARYERRAAAAGPAARDLALQADALYQRLTADDAGGAYADDACAYCGGTDAHDLTCPEVGYTEPDYDDAAADDAEEIMRGTFPPDGETDTSIAAAGARVLRDDPARFELMAARPRRDARRTDTPENAAAWLDAERWSSILAASDFYRREA